MGCLNRRRQLTCNLVVKKAQHNKHGTPKKVGEEKTATNKKKKVLTSALGIVEANNVQFV